MKCRLAYIKLFAIQRYMRVPIIISFRQTMFFRRMFWERV